MGLLHAVASFFVAGLGQGLKGEVMRGFKILAGSFIIGATQIVSAMIHPTLGWLVAIVGVFYWFANVLDAHGVFRMPIS